MPQEIASRTSQASISAALAAAGARMAADPGASLADMAQRDLDAALQLLANRAQYITGSSGAAIALRRKGKKDMLCRASAGSNAPELGALLSTEFGLSAESVRSRQVLRCDDVERDARVNRDACRQLGIASVAVMPVVNDEEVLGVFELFSGKVNAFGERDLTALRRLGEMVETAVKLSRAAEQLPEHLLESPPAPTVQTRSQRTEGSELDDSILDVEGDFIADAALPQASLPIDSVAAQAPPEPALAERIEELPASDQRHSESVPPKLSPPEATPKETARPLLWSIAFDPANSVPAPSEQGPVPPTLRNLRKCQACGFPVSPERTLCVECEEKKWRGQLRPGPTLRVPAAGGAAAAVAPAPSPSPSRAPAQPKQAFALASAVAKSAQLDNSESAQRISAEVPSVRASSSQGPQTDASAPAPAPEPELVLTAAMHPSQSWVAEHKVAILTLLAIGAGAAVVWLR